jgi:hypothetical protein
MDTKESYFAKALVWSIKSDFDFVRWLVDSRDFKEEAIRNKLLRVLYRASVKSYAKMAPMGQKPAVDDVGLEIERIAGDEIAKQWLGKIDQMTEPKLGLQKDVANTIAEEYDRARVLGYIEEWMGGVKSGEIKGLINKSFSDMADSVAGLLTGGQSTGRPRDILEAARAQRLHEPQGTGYSRINTAIDGGWTPSKFYICGMPSGHGKTSLCCNFASRRCEMGLPTIIHSMEMPARDLLFRMICDLANVSIDVAENPGGYAVNQDEIDNVRAAEELLDSFVRVYDTPADTPEMERRIRRHKAEFGGAIILNEIDHIGIVRRGGRGTSEWSELESMAYSLVTMAQANSVPVLAYSQVPTEVEQELIQNNIIIYNKDFRGSRGIRNAVDYAIMGCKHSGIVEDPETGARRYDHSYINHSVIQVTKNRRTGKQFWGVFDYNPIYYRLTNKRNEGTREDIYG